MDLILSFPKGSTSRLLIKIQNQLPRGKLRGIERKII